MKLKITLLVSMFPFLFACSAVPDAPAQATTAPAVAPTAVRQVEERLGTGDFMPLTTLTSIENQQISLMHPTQRKLVIFFGTTCSDSQRAFKKIMASALVKEPALQIVGIGRDANVASLRKFATDYQVSFPLVVDTDRAMYHKFTNQGIPRIVLVDENNRIVKSFLGEIPDVVPEIKW